MNLTGVDQTLGLSFGIDLTPLIIDPTKEVASFVQEHIDRFAEDISACRFS